MLQLISSNKSYGHSYSITHWSLSSSTTVLVDLVVSSSFVSLEVLDFLLRHQAGYHIGLDLLELEAETFVGIILFVCLILKKSGWSKEWKIERTL